MIQPLRDPRDVDAWQSIEERVLEGLPDGELGVDNQGGRITKDHVRRYLSGGRARMSFLVEMTARWAPGPRVAEVGVAYGSTLLFLRDFAGVSVTAFELAENIPVYCGGLVHAGIEVHPWSAYESTVRGDFDLVICSEVLEHLFVNEQVLAERLRNLVRVGGRVIVTTPNVYSYQKIRAIVLGHNIQEPHPTSPRIHNGVPMEAREHPREYCARELESAFGTHGWRLLSLEGWNDGAGPKGRIFCALMRYFTRRPAHQVLVAIAERVG